MMDHFNENREMLCSCQILPNHFQSMAKYSPKLDFFLQWVYNPYMITDGYQHI